MYFQRARYHILRNQHSRVVPSCMKGRDEKMSQMKQKARECWPFNNADKKRRQAGCSEALPTFDRQTAAGLC